MNVGPTITCYQSRSWKKLQKGIRWLLENFKLDIQGISWRQDWLYPETGCWTRSWDSYLIEESFFNITFIKNMTMFYDTVATWLQAEHWIMGYQMKSGFVQCLWLCKTYLWSLFFKKPVKPCLCSWKTF